MTEENNLFEEIPQNVEDELTLREQEMQKYGVDTSKVGRKMFLLNQMRKNGILVDVTIRGKSLFTTTSDFLELGIGVKQGDKRSERYRKPTKFLIPKSLHDKYTAATEALRILTKKYAAPIAVFYPYDWISYKAYPEWKAEWEEKYAVAQEVKDEILNNYDEIREGTIQDFAQSAQATWQMIKSRGKKGIRIGEIHEFTEESEFIDYVVENAISRFPSYRSIEENLTFDYTVAMIWSDVDVTAEQARIDKANAVVHAEVTEKRLQEEILAEQRNQLVRENQLANREKELQIEAMMAVEMEHARKQIEDISSPIVDLVKSLRGKVAEDANKMLKSIKKNGFLRKNVVDNSRGLIALYELMTSMHSDDDLRKKIGELNKLIDRVDENNLKGTSTKMLENIEASLKELVDISHAEVDEIMAENNTFDYMMY